MSFSYKEITNGVTFGCFKDERYKTNRISVNFVTEATADNITVNALIPRLLKKGYKGLNNNIDFYRELEDLYGATVSAGVQKRGDMQILTVSASAIDSKYSLKGENLQKLISELLCKVIFTPMSDENGFDRDNVTMEKRSLKEDIEGELNEKRLYVINKATTLMCGNESYGLPKYGFIDKVDAITPDMAYTQYLDILNSSKIYIMFTGCGDSVSAENIFTKAFKDSNRSFKTKIESKTHQKLAKPVEQTEELPVNQAKMVLGYSSGIKPTDEILPAARLMCTVLGGTPSSKLFENVREKMSLCYYCAARIDSFKGIILIDCGIENDNIEKARKAIIDQFEDMKKGNFEEDKIEFAKLSLSNSYKSLYESDFATESFYLTKLLLNNVLTPEEEMKKIDKVTKEQIVEAANKFDFEACFILKGNGDTEDDE